MEGAFGLGFGVANNEKPKTMIVNHKVEAKTV